jgi:hypothetical protein
MASQPPFLLADNVFDRINLYPLALLTWNTAITGQEGNYVADYRRERTLFQTAAAAVNQGIVTNLGVGGNVLADTCWIDRGHNLWGKNLQVGAGADGVTWTETVTRLVPALGTVGGDPTAAWCVTEEGALYTILPGGTFNIARQYWLVRVTDNWAPLFTGIILGKRMQMLNYSSVLDEDEGERDERQENSLIKGYYGRERVYTGRKLRLQLATIGITEYDTLIRSMRRLLFERDQPFFTVMNYGTKPERGWLYQYQGTTFSAPAERVYRRHSFVAQELGPLIR